MPLCPLLPVRFKVELQLTKAHGPHGSVLWFAIQISSTLFGSESKTTWQSVSGYTQGMWHTGIMWGIVDHLFFCLDIWNLFFFWTILTIEQIPAWCDGFLCVIQLWKCLLAALYRMTPLLGYLFKTKYSVCLFCPCFVFHSQTIDDLTPTHIGNIKWVSNDTMIWD